MKYATVDGSQKPILHIVINGIDPTPEQLDEHFAEWKAMLEELADFPYPCVIIVDATQSKFLSSEVRIKIGKFLNDNDVLMKKHIKLIVQVISNPLINIILKGILLVQKPSVPQTVVNSMSKALALASENLEEAAVR